MGCSVSQHPWDQYLDGLIRAGAIRPYQLRWLRDALSHTRFAALGARQIGKGWTVALIAVTLAVGYYDADGRRCPGHDVKVLSKDKRTSKNMLSMIRKHVEAAERIYGKFTNPRLGGLTEVYVLHGGKIESLPGTPKSAQGLTGSVIIDELAANSWDPEELFAQAASVGSSEDYMRFMVLSNAGVAGQFAHKFFQGDGEWAERRAQFVVSSTTIYDAYEGLLPDRFIGLRKSISPAMWARFYENSFESSGAGVLVRSQIGVAEAPRKGLVVAMGVDPGFGQNPTGICVAGFDPRSQRVWVLHTDWWFDADVDRSVSKIRALQKQWGVRQTFVDVGSAGFLYKNRLGEGHGMEYVRVSAQGKQRMLTAVTDLVGRGSVYLDSAGSGQEIFLQDLEQVVWDHKGFLDLGRVLVRAENQAATSRGAAVGRELHADSMAAFSYFAEWLGSMQGQAPSFAVAGGVTARR